MMSDVALDVRPRGVSSASVTYMLNHLVTSRGSTQVTTRAYFALAVPETMS